jgi:Mg-chelatase subunit ChlD
MKDDAVSALHRWRLVLGSPAEVVLTAAGGGLSETERARDAALDWLYGREHGEDDRDIRERGAGGGPAGVMTVPRWLDEVHRLFPRETIERLERDAVERYRIDEVVTNPEILKRIEPNPTLLAAVLRVKHLMNPEVLAMARELVQRVVKQLMDKLAREVRRSFQGARDPRRRSLHRIARNLDVRSTVRANLRNYQREPRRLLIAEPLFFSRVRRSALRWQVILLVDQSGSMLSSVIHSAVTAACLSGLPSMKTHLVAWDTEVVDLTGHVGDPVEALMKVQLGGGNDAAKALGYAAGLIESPRRTIVAVISDFYEGAGAAAMIRRVKALTDQGTLVLGLAALDDRAVPAYDRDVARGLVEAGAHVAAMTPGELCAWIADKVGGAPR